MADISLRQYLKTVEQHVQNGRYEEAIAHSRRILEHFPRLAAAYRLLGLALVGLTRWDEAGEVFRRLLSAIPDDFIAHQQLSVIYEKLKRPAESLWHLERALDLQPNDQQSVSRLRELYSKERGMPLERVPMTTAALANQYLNNGLNDQAIEVLQQAVQRMPERVDLKLMLARAQWQIGQHIEAGETAVEVLQTLPYTLAANRIMTELWLEVERPADAQRFLSRVEEVEPYLALRLATGSAPAPEVLHLPELDYQQHVRRALTQQSPDWLENLTQQDEQPLDLSDELGDDWMNEIDPASDGPGPRRVTDNLPNLLDEDLTDTGQLSGLSPELLARIDAMRGMAADSTAVAEMPELPTKPQQPPVKHSAMLDAHIFDKHEPTMEEEALEADDSWLDDLARNDDFTIEASDVSATDDDWIGSLERAAGTTGDRMPTGLTGQLGDFDVDDSIEDLDAMLNSLEAGTATPDGESRPSTGLTDMLNELEQGPVPDNAPTILRRPTGLSGMLDSIGTDVSAPLDAAEPKKDTKPKLSGSLDVDTDNLDWVTEFDPELATGNTSPLNLDLVPASDAEDSLAWLQNSGIEIDEKAPARPYTASLEETFEEEDVSGKLANPNAWMDALGVEYARTDDLIADGQLPTEGDEDEDAMAWARGLDLVSNAPTSALPASDIPAGPPPAFVEDTEAESDPLDWMSDDSLLAEYEAFEGLQDEELEPDEFGPDAFDAEAWENETTVGPGYTDSFGDEEANENEAAPVSQPPVSAPLASDPAFDSADDEFDFADDELTEEELVENADLYAELLDSVGPGDEDDFIPDEYRSTSLSDSDTEGQISMPTSSWQPSDPDDPEQPSMSDDLEWLSDDALSDDEIGDDTYIPNPDADEPITDLDSFFGGPVDENEASSVTDGGEAELSDAPWLNDLDFDNEGEEAAAQETESEAAVDEFDWSIEPPTDVPAEAAWLSGLDSSTSDTGESAEEEYDWNSGFGDEAALATEEPDWLADIQDPMAVAHVEEQAEGTDASELPDDASWLADLDELELEDAADAPAEEAAEPMSWEPESGFDLATEGEIEDENEMGWLTQASDNVIVEDIGALSTEEDVWGSEDSEAEPAGEEWLAELDAPAEDEAVAQPLSSSEAGWLDTSDDSGLDWETLDDAEPSPTAGMTGLLNNIETQRYGTDMLESLETADDEEPAWLESVGVGDEDAALDDVETPSWMQELEAPAEPITSGIDWTASFEEDEQAADEGLAEPAATDGFDWENPAFAAENDVDQLSFGEVGEDEFAYDEDAVFDPDALSEEAVLDGEQPEWLSGVGETSDEEAWTADEEPADEPEWLSDLEGEPESEAENAPDTVGNWASEVNPADEFAYEQDDNLFGQTDAETVFDQENDESKLPAAASGFFTGTADETFDYSEENAEFPASETGEDEFAYDYNYDENAEFPVSETDEDEFAYDNTYDENAIPAQETGEHNILPVTETGYFSGTADENFDYTGDDQNWLASEEDAVGSEYATEAEEADWLADAESATGPEEPVTIEGLEATPAGFYSQANLSEADAVAPDVTDDDLRDYDFEEEIEATPAQNAPDWLNSMVPGLDLDFEAEEDAEDAAPEPTVAPVTPTRRKDFDWLETIVTEETQQRAAPAAPPPPPPSLPAVPAAPAAQGVGERMRRFVFKDLPSWMRGGTPAATVTPDPVATYPTPSETDAAQVAADLDRDFNADMDDDLFDDMDAEFDEFDNDTKQ